jgi:hypothetical protein
MCCFRRRWGEVHVEEVSRQSGRADPGADNRAEGAPGRRSGSAYAGALLLSPRGAGENLGRRRRPPAALLREPRQEGIEDRVAGVGMEKMACTQSEARFPQPRSL